jgi:hypothetical protein
MQKKQAKLFRDPADPYELRLRKKGLDSASHADAAGAIHQYLTPNP